MTYRHAQKSFVGGVASKDVQGRTDLSKYTSLLATAENTLVLPHGGAVKAPGTYFIAEVLDSVEETTLVPFSFSTTQEYVLEFSDNFMRVIRNDGVILDTSTTINITGITAANPPVVTTSGAHGFVSADRVYVDGGAGMPEATGFWMVSNATSTTFELMDMWSVNADGTGWSAYTTGGTADLAYKTASPYTAAEAHEMVHVQEADIMYAAHQTYAPRKLSRTAHDVWTFTIPDFLPDIAAPANILAARDSGSGSDEYTYTVASISSDTGEESLPGTESMITNDLTGAGNANIVTWDAVAGASRYIIYKEDNGVFGYIGGTTDLQFIDENIVADLADGPQEGNNPFNAVSDYPACVTFFEQRLAFAGTVNSPQGVWMSQSSNYENMGRSQPAKASDSIELRVKARQANSIRAMIPLEELLLMTSSTEFVIKPGEEGYLTPSNPVVRPHGYRGSSVLQPLVVGNIILYTYARGGVIRDLGYEFTTDKYQGNDLTILSRHLFEGKEIRAWAYQQVPDSIVWLVMNDGSLISITYVREHEVWAWCTHPRSAGTYFESVTAIGGATEDDVYFITKRTINNNTKRYVEKLASRLFTDKVEGTDIMLLDCGLTYKGTGSILSGFRHLVGETVTAYVDGTTITGLVVDANGDVDLGDVSVTDIAHVGLPYTATIETLPLDLKAAAKELGVTAGRQINLGQVYVHIVDTKGILVGPNAGHMEKLILRDQEDWGESTNLGNGPYGIDVEGEWYNSGRVTVQQPNPEPMHILSIMPDVIMGD